ESGRFLAGHGADGGPEAIERLHYHGMRAHDEQGGSGRAYLAGFLAAAGLDPDLVDEFRAAIGPTAGRPRSPRRRRPRPTRPGRAWRRSARAAAWTWSP